jgi:hypothetical protein
VPAILGRADRQVNAAGSALPGVSELLPFEPSRSARNEESHLIVASVSQDSRQALSKP